jgi:hypothetical protein
MLGLPEDDVDSDLPTPPTAAAAYWARLERAVQQGDVSPTAATVLLLHALGRRQEPQGCPAAPRTAPPAAVAALVAAGAALNREPSDRHGHYSTPLHLAAALADEELAVALCRALLARDASAQVAPAHVDNYGCTPLHVARTPGVVRLLLAAGACPRVLPKNRYSVLTSDAASLDADTCRTLLAAGASLRHGVVDGNPLLFARAPGVVEVLLATGVDVSALDCGYYGLLSVCRTARRDGQSCRMLLAAGASPTLSVESPLLVAESVEVVRALLDAGASTVCVRRDGASPAVPTALFSPAALVHPEATRALLASGVPVDAADSHGLSALCHARTCGVVEALLAAGAVPRLDTPEHYGFGAKFGRLGSDWPSREASASCCRRRPQQSVPCWAEPSA